VPPYNYVAHRMVTRESLQVADGAGRALAG